MTSSEGVTTNFVVLMKPLFVLVKTTKEDDPIHKDAKGILQAISSSKTPGPVFRKQLMGALAQLDEIKDSLSVRDSSSEVNGGTIVGAALCSSVWALVRFAGTGF